jgi:hypothetical protein
MARQAVKFRIPERDLENTDIVLTIDWNGQRLGTLRLSRGGVQWWAKHAKKKPTEKFNWSKFAKRLEG